MINIGIIGLGNVTLVMHLPILLSRDDLNISWICDTKNDVNNICGKKKIPFFNELDDALEKKIPELVLITAPYFQRMKIFKKLENKVSGIYFEKPFALNLKEYLDFSKNFENYALTVGYQRRSLGIVQTLKKIIDNKTFGALNAISINFGDIHYNYGGFRSNKLMAGGGIFLESGSHWIDAALFISGAKKIDNFTKKVKYVDELDVHGEGEFNIIDNSNNKIKCNFKCTVLENTTNKIDFKFNNCTIELFLFDDNSKLSITNNSAQKFYIEDSVMENFPNDSLSQGSSYWNTFVNSYKNKKTSYTSINEFLLTTQVIEHFYDK